MPKAPEPWKQFKDITLYYSKEAKAEAARQEAKAEAARLENNADNQGTAIADAASKEFIWMMESFASRRALEQPFHSCHRKNGSRILVFKAQS